MKDSTATKKRIKWNIELVRKVFEDGGCILLSTEYKNTTTKLKYICECEEENVISFVSFLQGARCKKCGYKKASKSNRSSIEEIKELFENNNCILLSRTYDSGKDKLHYVCECGRESHITLSNFKNGVRCYDCGVEKQAEKQRVPYSQVISEFEEIELIPMFIEGEYINKSTPLPYLCQSHLDKGIQYRSRNSVLSATVNGCYFCAREIVSEKLKNPSESIIEEFKMRNLTLLYPQNYKNKNKSLEFECNKHPGHIQKISLTGLRQSVCPCDFCREENRTSDINKRIRGAIYSWRKKSEEQCNFKCMLTGSQDYDIHHLLSYQTIFLDVVKSLSYEVKKSFEEYPPEELVFIKKKLVEEHEKLLGVCIHPKLHVIFHSLYGKFDNTPDQFEEFKQRYYEGEFEKMIDINTILNNGRGA